jgi:tetratricopeptide (TPR) repeat protein
MIRRGGWLPLLLLAAGCAKNIDEGQAIKEIAASDEKTAPAEMPVARTDQVQPDVNRALENYEKLLDLPQDPAARAETMRRLADLQLEMDEQGGGTLAQSDARLRRSIELYTTVLREHPTGATNDRVLYQLGRAYQSLGDFAKGEEALLRLTREYPQSSYADDAHFRRAELLFKLEQFDDASAEYRQVLQLKEATPFFEAAQYKYGWSEYRQSNYENALMVFMTILSRELPPGEISDLKVALEGVKPGKKDMTTDALRVTSLAFTQLGGPEAANKYFAKHGEPPYAPLVYNALGAHLLEKKRYTDSARTYEAFIAAHPKHPLAPEFLAKAIAAQDLGGFIEPVVAAKENYVRHFDPAAPYWAGSSPTPAIMASLRAHMEDLARYYQARGQRPREAGTASAKVDFDAAVKWYQRLLALFPQDPKAAELRFLMAESMFEAGDVTGAAREYNKVVTEHPNYEKAPDAAYAALLAFQKHSETVPEAERPAALRQSVAAGLQLAERYAGHAQALPALTRAAEELYRLNEYDRAVQVAERVLKAAPPPSDALRTTAWHVAADAHFSQKRYPQAEAAYTELLKLLPPTSEERPALGERLATSIYKQAEAARDTGNAQAAADAFLRVGRVVPAATVRATADYDAATMLIVLKDWTQAAAVLESFRAANPAHALLPEVDKKLSVAYESAGKPKEAATVLQRIAARTTETMDTRRDAAWLAVTLLDQARDPRAATEYEAYLKAHPQPLERAIEARQKLADFADARKDTVKRQYWLREVVTADKNGGAARTPRTKLLAAQAVLEFGRNDAVTAARVPLKLPLKQSLPLKKKAMEKAIATLSEASAYSIAEVSTAATFELGVLYQDLSRDLLASQRPGKLSAIEREQYDLLLEEQAFPFEEKAIEWHEANLKLVPQGFYTPWVGKSLQALVQIAPGKYAKREQVADVYEGRPPSAATATLGLRPKQPAPAPAKSATNPAVIPATKSAAPPTAAAKPGTIKPSPIQSVPPGAAKPAATAETPAAPPATPAERYAQALQLLKTNQFAAAETAFAVSVKDYPQFTGSHTNLGIAYAKLNRKPEALAAFAKAVALDASNAVAHNWLGVVARETNDLGRAEQAYQQALAAEPDQAEAQLNLAILYDQHLKRPAEALGAYQRYEEITGKKDLRSAVWIAELQSQLPPAAATVQAPATPPAAAPTVPSPAPTSPKPVVPRKTGATP